MVWKVGRDVMASLGFWGQRGEEARSVSESLLYLLLVASLLFIKGPVMILFFSSVCRTPKICKKGENRAVCFVCVLLWTHPKQLQLPGCSGCCRFWGPGLSGTATHPAPLEWSLLPGKPSGHWSQTDHSFPVCFSFKEMNFWPRASGAGASQLRWGTAEGWGCQRQLPSDEEPRSFYGWCLSALASPSLSTSVLPHSFRWPSDQPDCPHAHPSPATSQHLALSSASLSASAVALPSSHSPHSLRGPSPRHQRCCSETRNAVKLYLSPSLHAVGFNTPFHTTGKEGGPSAGGPTKPDAVKRGFSW